MRIQSIIALGTGVGLSCLGAFSKFTGSDACLWFGGVSLGMGWVMLLVDSNDWI